MSDINTIHTSCRNCVFSIYENDTQIGCHIDYIEKFKSNGIEVLEAYDDNKEFFIINNKKCLGYRENSWFDENSTIEEKIKKYNDSNKLHYLLIINLKNMDNKSFEDICSQISKLSIQPQRIIFIRYIDDNMTFPYDYIKQTWEKSGINTQWRIQTMVDESLSYREILHNIVVINPKYRFVCSIDKYTNEISKIIDYTNKLVHEDFGQFNIISNIDKSCLIFSSIVYRYNILEQKDIINNNENYITI